MVKFSGQASVIRPGDFLRYEGRLVAVDWVSTSQRVGQPRADTTRLTLRCLHSGLETDGTVDTKSDLELVFFEGYARYEILSIDNATMILSHIWTRLVTVFMLNLQHPFHEGIKNMYDEGISTSYVSIGDVEGTRRLLFHWFRFDDL